MHRTLCFLLLAVPLLALAQQHFTVVELNTENLFDTAHDSAKADREFLPTSGRHWTRGRYWRKINRIGQEIISCGEDSTGWNIPDIVGLCEVENDTVLRDLTKRSLLRQARYEYVMTDSPDDRGVDVALLYSPFTFKLISNHSFRIPKVKGMRNTRDILYVSGEIISGDTMHVFVVHAPSRFGGEKFSRPFRQLVADVLCGCIDSIFHRSPDASIIVMGDFNDYDGGKSLENIYKHGMFHASQAARGKNGAKGTYRYQGEWGSLDHIFVSRRLMKKVLDCRINDAEFLLEEDKKYGGVQPRRNYIGPRYNNGFSDHLPLVMRLAL